MSLVQEIEQVITELVPEQAAILKSWLHGLEATRSIKKLEAYNTARQALVDFQKNNGNALLN